MDSNRQNQRLTTREKNADKKKWYKEQAEALDIGFTTYDDQYRKMRINYDLYNNILNIGDFQSVCKPLADGGGELPSNITNRDITSSKIKALLGMESRRPFSWKVLAVNPEATTRREQEELGQIKDYVIQQTLGPIRETIAIEHQQQVAGRQLTEKERLQIQESIEKELQARTPKEIKKYMEREYQDPVEVMSHQLLEYLIEKNQTKKVFNDAFKDLLISGKEIVYVGILNGEPQTWNINPIRFNHERSSDNYIIEDSEWATCEYRMIPSDVIKFFGDELTPKEIDKVYDYATGVNNRYDNLFNFDIDYEFDDDYEEDRNTVRVLHVTWKSLRKIGFLSYYNENGEIQESIVDDMYKVNKDNGDVGIEWFWIPEVYETWRIHSDIYVHMRPIVGQFKDLDNLYHCKLPYYGVVCDSRNSETTSVIDRIKPFQYYYNVIMDRLELVIASDKGKKIMIDISTLPKSADMSIENWMYYIENSPYIFTDQSEEGGGEQTNEVDKSGKLLDLSLTSDISKYIELAEYLKRQAGESVGITAQVEGQIAPTEAVTNTQQILVQSSYILDPYFKLHDQFKKNVLTGLLETAKVAYSNSNKTKLSYILDDLSTQIINLNVGLLDASSLGIFVGNSSEAEDIKDAIKQLAHAAMQNNSIELSDVISVLKVGSIAEMTETLKVAENRKQEEIQNLQQQEAQSRQQESQAVQEEAERQRQHEKELTVLKEEEQRKTEIIKTGLTAAGFNPDQDKDNDGRNDFIEVAAQLSGMKLDQTKVLLQKEKQDLDKEKFEHQKKTDNEKLKIEKQKAKKEKI